MHEGLKSFIYKGREKRELIKLENIFELLGSIDGKRTIDIIDEMIKSNGSYTNLLKKCRSIFVLNKEEGLSYLRNSTSNKRLIALSDALRVFTFSDKNIAMQIMERQRMENEESSLLTVEEDMDVLDIIAFLSVIPVVYQLANMILMPMIETINQVFMLF